MSFSFSYIAYQEEEIVLLSYLHEWAWMGIDYCRPQGAGTEPWGGPAQNPSHWPVHAAGLIVQLA